MRTSFHHQSEAEPPNGPLTAATSPDTPSAPIRTGVSWSLPNSPQIAGVFAGSNRAKSNFEKGHGTGKEILFFGGKDYLRSVH